jgi:hypothetical protein
MTTIETKPSPAETCPVWCSGNHEPGLHTATTLYIEGPDGLGQVIVGLDRDDVDGVGDVTVWLEAPQSLTLSQAARIGAALKLCTTLADTEEYTPDELAYILTGTSRTGA